MLFLEQKLLSDIQNEIVSQHRRPQHKQILSGI